MPKEKKTKSAGAILRHAPLGTEIERPTGKLRPPRQSSTDNHSNNKNDRKRAMDDNDDVDAEEEEDCKASSGGAMAKKLRFQAREQMRLMDKEEQEGEDGQRERGSAAAGGGNKASSSRMLVGDSDEDDDEDDDDDGEEEGDDEQTAEGEGELDEELIHFDGEYISGGTGSGLSSSEEDVVNQFLQSSRDETRTLSDIIMEKLQEMNDRQSGKEASALDAEEMITIPDKVMTVFTSVGKLLKHYKSGKLPKALKMLPHLKNWEHILWITRPDEWSPAATYATTRIFVSNLNEKMAQRFFNLVLLEKCRDDIQTNDKLNYYLYLALKKSLFKPASFYKGVLLPLANSGTCTLREATIIGSVLSKVSIPGNHSAAVLLRLAQMPYSGSTSLFIKVLLNKKYALPTRVIDVLVTHFTSFMNETRVLPVLWHQSLLVFAQRYKFELSGAHRESLKLLLKTHSHHLITNEIRRELFAVTKPSTTTTTTTTTTSLPFSSSS